LQVEHIFVLMLENRSFDHVLGFSEISGRDVSGRPCKIDGLKGDESNFSPDGEIVRVSSPASYLSEHGPGHEFKDVREQLCGVGGTYSSPAPPPGQLDPHITNAGFLRNYARYERKDPGSIMRCFLPSQLPVLNALAREFALCDRWFSSMPGPTWPNRLFIHAGSSGGLDDSPSFTREFRSMTTDGFRFDNGTIFDLLDESHREWSVYSDDEFPQALSIAGMRKRLDSNFRSFKTFADDIADPSFSQSYVFIEPDYHAFTGKFRGGNSQHPMDDVTSGERFLKSVYEAVRASPCWEKSLLLVTYDEHGGFFDHTIPPAAVEPGDSTMPGTNNNGFDFRQLGARVATIVVSPFIARGTIDNTLYDHTSALATTEELFHLGSLTKRDKNANSLSRLLTLKTPRDDAPMKMPEPAYSGYVHKEEGGIERLVEDIVSMLTLEKVDPSMSGFHHIAMLRDSAGADPSKSKKLVDSFYGHRGFQARRYMRRVRQDVARNESSRRREKRDPHAEKSEAKAAPDSR
jgi:phospholipase C